MMPKVILYLSVILLHAQIFSGIFGLSRSGAEPGLLASPAGVDDADSISIERMGLSITPNFTNPVGVPQDDSTDVTITLFNDGDPPGFIWQWSAWVSEEPAIVKSSQPIPWAKPTVADAVEGSPNKTPLPAAWIEAPFDLQFMCEVSGLTGGFNAGSEFDGAYFYVSRWASNLLHKRDANCSLLEEFSIPGVSGLRDLAYDGTYMYGGTAGKAIYQMDFDTKTLVGVISSPIPVRHIAYDESMDAFWVGNWDTDIVLVDRTGSTVATIPAATHGLSAMYGSAYDSYSAGSPYLWVYDQGGGAGTPQFIHQFMLPSGIPTGVSFDVNSVVANDGIAGGLWISEGIEPGLATIGGVQQGTPDYLFGLELTRTAPEWIRLVGETSGSIGPGEQFDLAVRLYGIGEPIDTAYVNISSNDPVLPLVNVMVIRDIVDAISDLPHTPGAFGIAQNYPNPFNPTTRFSYQLPQHSDVKLVIYNVLGQKVRTLINGQVEAGYHAAVWDGRNDKGMQDASGVYIYRFEAGDYVKTMKLLLLR